MGTAKTKLASHSSQSQIAQIIHWPNQNSKKSHAADADLKLDWMKKWPEFFNQLLFDTQMKPALSTHFYFIMMCYLEILTRSPALFKGSYVISRVGNKVEKFVRELS